MPIREVLATSMLADGHFVTELVISSVYGRLWGVMSSICLASIGTL